MFSTIHIETERLLIRAFSLDDLPAFHAMVSEPEVMSFLPEDVMSLEEAKDILSWLIESYEVNTRKVIRRFTVAIVLRNSGEVIGWGSGSGRLSSNLPTSNFPMESHGSTGAMDSLPRPFVLCLSKASAQ